MARDGAVAGSSMSAGPVAFTAPSNSTELSAASAESTTRAGTWRTRSPVSRAAGSQTNVTRVLPFSPLAPLSPARGALAGPWSSRQCAAGLARRVAGLQSVARVLLGGERAGEAG